MSSFADNWISNETKDTRAKNHLKKSGYSQIFIQLLANRGFHDLSEIRSYIKPSLKALQKPELLPNIRQGTDRVKEAIFKQEKILIFGDYDTDGIISTALLYNFFNELNISVDYYIPDRFTEGYDINTGFLKKNNIEKNYDLVVCVDCGSNAIEVQKDVLSGKLDIDVVVCDHHEMVYSESIGRLNRHGVDQESSTSGKGTHQYIIINPKYPGSKYPFKMLSGGGVTFKFIWSVMKETGLPELEPREYLKNILDLVAISTISDLMPLAGENRIIVKKGLEVIKNTMNDGLKRLLRNTLKDRDEISTYDIGFIIAPRLNASGRIEDAVDSLKILLNDSFKDNKIEELISKLDILNAERQKLQQSTLKEIEESGDFSLIKKKKKVFISESSCWNEGVLGVVASDIVKKYSIPAILFKAKNGILKGSGRSIEGFNLYENLAKVKKYFIKFGGHQQACGITMEEEKFKSFKKSFEEIAYSSIKEEELVKRLYYDIEISFNDICPELLNEIKLMEPFGIGNQKPLFLTNKCLITSDISYSKNGKHVFFQIKNSKRVYSAVVFNYLENKDRDSILSKGNSIDILYNIEHYKNKAITSNPLKIVIQSFR